MKKQATALLWACALILSFTACKKGDTGPQGPQGDPGAAGVKGDKGDPGPSAKSYEFSMSFGPNTNSQVHNMPQYSVINKTVLVYIDLGFHDWTLLNYMQIAPGFVPVYFKATVDDILEKITIETQRGDSQTGTPWATNTTKNFKAVCIETTSGAKPGINYEDYRAVKEYYNLPD